MWIVCALSLLYNLFGAQLSPIMKHEDDTKAYKQTDDWKLRIWLFGLFQQLECYYIIYLIYKNDQCSYHVTMFISSKVCKQGSESENFLKWEFFEILIYSKSSLITLALAVNIVANSGSLAENMSLLLTTATAATLFLFILWTVSIYINHRLFWIFEFG